jgi:hypothetical protein
MQKSPCSATVRVIIREQLLAVTSFSAVRYDRRAKSVVAVSAPILPGLLHDISKTGPVHAKFKVVGIKGFTKIGYFTISVLWIMSRSAHLAPSPA